MYKGKKDKQRKCGLRNKSFYAGEDIPQQNGYPYGEGYKVST